ncbi:MAG: MBL fold metallo-hydrolase [Spirochaetales bacterium]|nr:MBL fold metallo-hydrolase [Spirochaetales bacterium]
MKITMLGTGTSCGVPFIGCHCPVCLSEDPKDKRCRSSILIEKGNTKVVIDTGYEFRLQCLRSGVERLDGVLYTHAHPDHLFGLDDLRAFYREEKSVDIWGSKGTIDRIKTLYPYVFKPFSNDGLPHLSPHIASQGVPFLVGEIEFIPFFMTHGPVESTGYRFGNCAYVTDVSDIREEENLKYLENLDVLIIDALMEKKHPSHLSFGEACEIGKKCGAKRVYFTHISHTMKHVDIERKYNGIAKPSYDTMTVEVDDE